MTLAVRDQIIERLDRGLLPSHVRFDIIGTGQPVLIQQRSGLTGFILAIHRTVAITTNSYVIGNVTGSKVQLSTGGKIISPPAVSP